jgi:hypothetical protein
VISIRMQCISLITSLLFPCTRCVFPFSSWKKSCIQGFYGICTFTLWKNLGIRRTLE